MKHSTLVVLCTGAILFSAAAFGISAHVDSPPSLMSRSDYAAAKQVIESEARQAIGRCRALDGSAREMCRAQARAEERVRKAELTARYLGTVSAAEEAKLARVRAEADLARARCNTAATTTERAECLAAARAQAQPRPAST